MTNQEAYEIMCHKAEKYDKMVDVLEKIRDEIRDLRYRGGLPTAEIFGYIKCLEIIDRYIEGEQK